MTTNILLLGGHGRISLLLTPLLLTNPSHHVTSVIRNPSHRREILALKETHPDKHPGKLSVLVSSLDDIHTPTDARRVLQQTSPKWIIWSAGAGGKGGPERTHAVDCRAAKCYIAAAVEEGSGVERFLMVSYVSSCRGYRSWWGEEDRRAADKVNLEVLPAYARAKIEADEFLAASSRRWEEEESDGDGGQGGERKWALCLRPATLTDEGAGRVLMGKTPARGQVSRETVAQVAAKLIGRYDAGGWWDLLDGEEEVDAAVDRLAKEGWDAMQDGEDVERIYAITE